MKKLELCDVRYMEMALVQARQAFETGQFPVGCVIVENDRVIAEGARKGTDSDRLRFSEIDHAEIRALKYLELHQIEFDPEKTALYCTMEPCLMCYAAIVLSGIPKIVYAYEDAMGGGTSCDFSKMPILYKNSCIDITSGVLRQKSLDLFYDFFNKETNQYWKGSYLEQYTLDQKQGIRQK